MSESERPEGSGERGGQGGSLPARSMADIARLFLDGARPSGAASPRRTPPGRAGLPDAAGMKNESRQPAGEKAQVHLALGGAIALGDEGWAGLRAAAAALAQEQATTVAVLGFLNKQWVIEVAGAESVDELPTVRVEGAAGSADVQAARALFTLRPAVGAWLIAAPAAGTPAFAALAGRVSQWLVVCPTDNDGLVATYQQLKRAAVLPAAASAQKRTIQAFMMPGAAGANAESVHVRLSRAAREFLGTELALLPAAQEAEAPLRVAAIAGADAATIWTAVLDELAPEASEGEEESAEIGTAEIGTSAVETVLEDVTQKVSAIARAAAMPFDQLGHVLDAEERAALSAAFEPVPEPVRPVRPSTPPAPMPVTIPAAARPAPSAKTVAPAPADLIGPGGTLVLRAFDLLEAECADRAAQWQAVERSIRDFLPNATLLEARPPMAWASESTLAVDAEGRLHVWTLFRDGASWFALREWATEHRGILALTRRDLVLNHDAEVAVHIVMPLDCTEAGGALPRAAARHVTWYRLRAVQWAGRRGALVVPAA